MTVIPEIAVPFVKGVPRLMPVLSDEMYPTIDRGDFLFALPVKSFQYDSIYVLDNGLGHSVFRVTGFGDRITLTRDNKSYSPQEITRAEFDEAVDALVVGYIKVIDDRYFGATG